MADRILGLVGPPTARDRLAYEATPPPARASCAASRASARSPRSSSRTRSGSTAPAIRRAAEAEIPLESRIVACAVAYVGLSRLVGGSEAVRGLQRQAGSALDPEVVIAALAFLTRDSGHPARPLGDVPRPESRRRRGADSLSSQPMAYPLLLSPLRIGPIEIRNRIVSTAHQTTLVEDGLPTDDFVAYHAARAEGGVGLICIEATAVHPSGLLTGHTIAGYDPRVVDRLALRGRRRPRRAAARSSRSCSTAGASRSTHRRARRRWRPPPCRASASRSSRARSAAAEIEEIIAHHELVAGHARAAGLDGIELCASHGYLPTQFLSERSNRRDDAWGGDAERPPRYVREALRAMRRGAGAASRSASGSPPTSRSRRAATPPETAGDPAHARRRGTDRLRERRDRGLGQLPRRGLDRAAAADRARCHARAGERSCTRGWACR